MTNADGMKICGEFLAAAGEVGAATEVKLCPSLIVLAIDGLIQAYAPLWNAASHPEALAMVRERYGTDRLVALQRATSELRAEITARDLLAVAAAKDALSAG